jgi:hypothetical protein
METAWSAIAATPTVLYRKGCDAVNNSDPDIRAYLPQPSSTVNGEISPATDLFRCIGATVNASVLNPVPEKSSVDLESARLVSSPNQRAQRLLAAMLGVVFGPTVLNPFCSVESL